MNGFQKFLLSLGGLAILKELGQQAIDKFSKVKAEAKKRDTSLSVELEEPTESDHFTVEKESP